MPSLADFRAQTGDAYSDLNDRDLADGIYKKFYSDMPREQFDSKLGIAPEAAAAAPDSRSFLEKAGSFVRNVYNNPPPTIAAARDVIKGAPAAATELTWGADPQAAERAAGTMLGAAAIASPTSPGLRAGEGVLARGVGSPEARAAPVRPLPPATPGEQAVEAGSRIGVDVPRYLATENTVVPKAAAGIKNAPFGGDPIANAETRMLEQMGAAREAIAPNARSPDLAGESARGGVSNWITAGSKRPVSEAYQAVDRLIDPQVRAPLDNTRAMVADIMGQRAQARIPGTSRAVERVMPAVQDPAGMDYQGAKMLRSFLGETTPQELVAQGINPVEAKRLYGALTKDLGSIITQAGGEGAHAAWREANTLARLTSMQKDALTKLIGAKGDMSPEGVFNRLLNYAGSKSSADLNRLRLARRTMGPAAWDEVGSAFIARMGRPPDGGFSADRFVTAFSNLSPQARSELFTPQQHAALNDLMTVSQRYKDLVSKNLNTSGTARGVLSGMFGGHLLADPVSAIGGMLGTRLAAEALSRPAVVRAAAQVARRAQSGNPAATRNALERLRDVAGREGLFNAVQEPPMRKFADGGRPYKDEPVVVGERGPEVFVPDQAGTVLPNGWLEGAQYQTPAQMLDPSERAAVRQRNAVRPPLGRQEGPATEFIEKTFGLPKTPLEAGMKVAMGPYGKAGAKIGALALGGLMSSSEAEAGGVGPLWHGISKVKLPRSLAEMYAGHVPTTQLPEKVIAPEAMQGGWLLPAWGDRSVAGSRLTQVGEQRLRTPVEMQGGAGFMPANAETGAAWASGKPVVGRLAKQARELAAEGDPVYFPYTAMGERSVDFSHHVSDTLTEMLKAKPLAREAATKFNDMMRAADANFPAIEDWPGLNSPKLREYLAKASGDVRNKFAKKMDTREAQALGLPSVAEARHAVTDPRLLDAATGDTGLSIARLDPEGRVISNPAAPHRTYDTQLGGQYVGGLEQSVPKEIAYPDMLDAYRKMGYDPFRFDYLMQRGVKGAPVAQRVDQRVVDDISKYLEASRRGQ